MNLSDLKKAVLARKGKTVEVPEWGLSVSFLPIGVHRALGIHASLKLLPTNDTGGIVYGQESVAAFVDAISASVADSVTGERFLDSDEGRTFLREQSFAVLEQLTAEAMRASGILTEDDGSKNSPTPAETST